MPSLDDDQYKIPASKVVGKLLCDVFPRFSYSSLFFSLHIMAVRSADR